MKLSNLLRRLLLLPLLLLAAEDGWTQTLVPATTEYLPGTVAVRFFTTPGKLYRIEQTSDLQNWTFNPESIYGLGQQARFHVHEPPHPQAPTLPTSLPSTTCFSSPSSRMGLRSPVGMAALAPKVPLSCPIVRTPRLTCRTPISFTTARYCANWCAISSPRRPSLTG